MKLTLNNPGIISELANLQVGLMPMRRRNGNLLLIIKCSKEMILTAKIRKGFRFYLAPIQIESLQTYGLITAFFDDHDEPLTIRTPLVEEEMVAAFLNYYRWRDSRFIFSMNIIEKCWVIAFATIGLPTLDLFQATFVWRHLKNFWSMIIEWVGLMTKC